MEQFVRKLEKNLEDAVKGLTPQEVLRFIKPMWREEKKIVAFRAQKLERRLLEKGKSPLPAERVRKSIKEYNIGSKKKEQQRFLTPSGLKPRSCIHIKGEFLKPETLFKLDKAADKSSSKSVREGSDSGVPGRSTRAKASKASKVTRIKRELSESEDEGVQGPSTGAAASPDVSYCDKQTQTTETSEYVAALIKENKKLKKENKKLKKEKEDGN